MKPRKMHTQIKDRKYLEYQAKAMEDMKNPQHSIEAVVQRLRESFAEAVTNIFPKTGYSILPHQQAQGRAKRVVSPADVKVKQSEADPNVIEVEVPISVPYIDVELTITPEGVFEPLDPHSKDLYSGKVKV